MRLTDLLACVAVVVLGVVLGAPLGGCGQPKGGGDSVPVVADDNLAKDEDQLFAQRGELQREHKKLTDERAEIAEKRKAITDKKEAAELDDQEAQLAKRETDLVGQENDLAKKLDTLLQQRSEMIKSAAAQLPTGASPEERATRREQAVAVREKDLARREAELAERETQLASRERDLAKREKETCGVAAAAPMPKFELPKALKYGPHDVEPIYKRALKAMQEHGLLAADLPGGGRLLDDTRAAMQSGDYVRAKYDADQLLEEVQGVRIDRAFIAAKMARLSSAMKGRSLQGDTRRQADALLQEATGAYGDGKFPQANQKINRIYALLK